MKATASIVSLATLLLTYHAYGCSPDGKEGFLPDNGLQIPITQKDTGLTRLQYDSVIDKFEEHYSTLVNQSGGRLQINRLWNSPVVNAGTSRENELWIINLYGGLARHPAITEDGFALVLCHEFGHHVGGAPKKIDVSAQWTWSSTEGQADYFATLKCLRQLFSTDKNRAIVKNMEVPKLVTDKCESSFYNQNDEAMCKRISMAGHSVATLNALTFNFPLPVFETPDESIVNRTMDGHPNVQCRLDSYFSGAICKIGKYQEVSQTDEVTGTCHLSSGYTSGTRPLCWFKPLE